MQCERNDIVYSDRCLRNREMEILLGKEIWYDLQVEGMISMYSDVFLRFMVRELFLGTVL